jgi:ribonuclease-3
MSDYSVLCKRLDYQFKDPKFLKIALTHRSANKQHYERMEFLGDAILNLIITDNLYHRFPDASEGKLSRLRASMVKGETLSKLAKQLELGEFLNLGSGELKSGGFRRESILADVFESIIGAIYLDQGYEPAQQFVLRMFSERLQNADINVDLKDPKTRLQEYLQAQGQDLPVYEILSTSGKAHNQTFEVACHVPVLNKSTQGAGNSRRKAEQVAARRMLQELEQDD